MRCFVAIDLPEELQAKAKNFQRLLAFPNVKLVRPENLHLTLLFLGELDEAKLRAVKLALAGVSFPKFEIFIKGLSCFPSFSSPRVIYLSCHSKLLSELASEVERKLLPLGIRRDKPFVAHLTLARVKGKTSERLFKVLEEHRNMELGNFVATEFKLKRSVLTPSGPIYSDLLVIKLGDKRN